MFTGFSIEVEEYKSFTDGLKLDLVSNINVIIGKNNSGKSNVMEVINRLFKSTLTPERIPKTIFHTSICFTNTYDELEKIRSETYPGNSPLSKSEFDRNHSMCKLQNKNTSDTSNWQDISIHHGPSYWISFEKGAIRKKTNDFNNCICFHLQAERMVTSEEKVHLDSNPSKSISPNGAGFTNLLRHILQSRPDFTTYKELLIKHMNVILAPEIIIDDVQVLSTDDSNRFEIFIKESGKQFYQLSILGSGIKTTFQLVMLMEIIPKLTSRKKESLIFTLEELENNLHPSAQRRMYRYIDNYATENNSIFFISTHSNVPLNYYFGNDNACIYHVTQNNGISRIDLISSPLGSRAVMDDLGVNPSDILQSNGIIWVEGPSDRIYIKKWLEIANFGDLVEGEDYQFMYYGGRLLNHYSTEDEDSLINILKINRHSALIMDSDKKNENGDINDTKKRILNELNENNLYSWCTEGKEIENYLRSDDITSYCPDLGNRQFEKYQPFSDFIGKENLNKVEFARNVTKHMTSDSIDIFDLKMKITDLGIEIRRWNMD